jgi:predicted O-methyltransferase YrrM
MNESEIVSLPESLQAIWRDTTDSGFTMPSDYQTGALLRMLAASRPNARLLELGTGTGLSAAWILDGMDAGSVLDSVDDDATMSGIAQRHLGDDRRLHLYVEDGADFLARAEPFRYDFIFADAWPGKYTCLDLAIASLKKGGLYIVDDMLPQPNWPDGHEEKAEALCETLDSRSDLRIVKLSWSTGLILAARIA